MGRDFINLNLRHLSAFDAVAQRGSISQAAGIVNLSQPAITNAIGGIENRIKARLFHRRPRGMMLTNVGAAFHFRVKRAFKLLNAGIITSQSPSTNAISGIEKRITVARLKTLIAIKKSGSYSAAARELGIAQPTIYRAAKDLEATLGMALFEVSGRNLRLTRAGEALERNARLAAAELAQGMDEVETLLGREAGRIRIGALPLARATILAPAIDLSFESQAGLRIEVDDGPYPELLHAVRTGALDILVGAMRRPSPGADITQEELFLDRLGVFCGPGHPMLSAKKIERADLAAFPWVLPRRETPTRAFFDQALGPLFDRPPKALVETSSMVLMRALLQSHQRLTLISRAQVATEVQQGQLCELPIALGDTPRAIGFTCRSYWFPTEAQKGFLAVLRAIARQF